MVDIDKDLVKIKVCGVCIQVFRDRNGIGTSAIGCADSRSRIVFADRLKNNAVRLVEVAGRSNELAGQRIGRMFEVERACEWLVPGIKSICKERKETESERRRSAADNECELAEAAKEEAGEAEGRGKEEKERRRIGRK